MRVYNLRCKLLAPVSVQEAFSVFENPYNLARITPPGLGFKIVAEGLKMRRGLEIDYRIKVMGVRLRWKTLITEYEPPFQFTDEALKSPYVFWRHRHTFAPTDAGTEVSDSVEYALPLGWLGQTAHSIFVRRQLKGIFKFRQEALAELMGGQALRVIEEPAITVLK